MSTKGAARFGPVADPPRGAWRLARGSVVLFLAWCWVAFILTSATVLALVTFRAGVDRYRHVVARLLGRGILRISGIELRVIGAEKLEGRRMRLVALNHASQLDLFVVTAILPPGGTGIAKKEIFYIPFVGWAFFAFGVFALDRGNLDRAKASMARAAESLRAREGSIFMAPEGTRSRGGELGPFKMGLFHMAMQARTPITPFVIRGAAECLPLGQIIPHPGVITVEILPEYDTADLDESSLRDSRDALRARFVDALAAG